MKILKTGDTCPCCGSPIVTTNPADLLVLNLLHAELALQGRKIDTREYELFHKQLTGTFLEATE